MIPCELTTGVSADTQLSGPLMSQGVACMPISVIQLNTYALAMDQPRESPLGLANLVDDLFAVGSA